MSEIGWHALAEQFRMLPEADLDKIGVAAVTLLRHADDTAAWQWFAKAVQRARVMADMRDHPVWDELAKRLAVWPSIEAMLTESDEPFDEHTGDVP